MFLIDCGPRFDSFTRAFVAVSGSEVVGEVEVAEESIEEAADDRTAFDSNTVIRTWDAMKPARRKGDKQMWRMMGRGMDPMERSPVLEYFPGGSRRLALPFRTAVQPTFWFRRRQVLHEIEMWVRQTYGDAAWDGEENFPEKG